jgi:hypothetical protein
MSDPVLRVSGRFDPTRLLNANVELNTENKILRSVIEEYACHRHLDCYMGCTCNLNKLTDSLKLPRCETYPS